MAAKKPLSYQAQGGRRVCKLCKLKLADPTKIEQIESRLALGEAFAPLAAEFGLPRDSITRHWRRHADQREALRRVHRRDKDADVEALLYRAEVSGTAPMEVADRQIRHYASEFEDCRKRNDHEHRDRPTNGFSSGRGSNGS
jgi:hypothetical protein